MNYILGLLFLMLIFPYYYMVGRRVLTLFHYEYDFDRSILAGFITTFFIGFIIGEPLQLIHTSWTVYFIAISVALIAAGIFSFKKEYFVVSRKQVIDYLLDHWFIIFMVVVFLFFALTSLLPYYRMNYDDSYYIGKVVNQIGTNALLNENYFSGAVVEEIVGGITRSFNTFELLYGYFATVFHISVPFFCRAVMACNHYMIMFITYKCFAEIFVSKKNSQFVIALFAIFLIPCGYWQESTCAPFVLRIFDGWQFTTAMWYGGSAVRMISIPMTILFGKDLWEKIEWRKLIFVVMIYTTFIAFSTIFFHDGVILFIVFMIIKMIDYTFDEHKEFKVLGLVGVVGMITALILANKYIPSLSFINTESLTENVEEFNKYYSHYYSNCEIFTYGPIILLIGMMLGKNRYERYTVATFLGIYLLEFKEYFINIVMLSTGYYFFVALRLMSSLQYMIVLTSGIVLIAFFERIKLHRIVLTGLSLCVLASTMVLFYKDYPEITAQEFSGSGVIAGGYSLRTLTTNDEMIPPIYVTIGEYFNDLPYGNYSLMAPKYLDYQGFALPYVGFVCTSNRIEIFERRSGCNGLVKDEFLQIQSYFNGEIPYSSIQSIIEKVQIKYFLVQKENQKADMEAQGFTLVLESHESDPYYLYKTNY